jgi:uracil-DNA glycosylase
VNELTALLQAVRACRVCEAALGFTPRPVVQAGADARLLIIGQAPGSRVHASGVAWDDVSGDRLRDWLGLGRDRFYDPDTVALVPMGLCYPGKVPRERGGGGDLPPRPECAPLWHAPLLAAMPGIRLTLLVGHYAQTAYLPRAPRQNMTETVRRHAAAPDGLFPLPHPAWRSRLWMAKHPWFEAEVLPALRHKVVKAIEP